MADLRERIRDAIYHMGAHAPGQADVLADAALSVIEGEVQRRIDARRRRCPDCDEPDCPGEWTPDD